MPRIKSSDLQVNTPVEGSAPDTVLTIDPDPAHRLGVGTYAFQLTVTDDAGNVSAPTSFKLVVLDDGKPTAVITGPDLVTATKPITLSGDRSRDQRGGRIVKYTWTLVSAP